tara:strand:+ start:6169 stop:8577 length:2409 start_codon:yes stop_codon:yes gene_type:complete
MAQQDPNKRQDNKNSTPTSNIAPGEPLWIPQNHDQESFGPGYDHHDPISLLKGNITNEGGYESGNALTRFGTFTLEQNKFTTRHGSILDLKILRKGGSKGEYTFVMEVDRETGRVPGGTFDENTAILGDYRGNSRDGFNRCAVDIDINTLNTGTGFVYDSTNHRLNISFQTGEEEKQLRILLPYRTDIVGLNPITLSDSITYRIDEYETLDAKIRNLPVRGLLDASQECIGIYPEEAAVNHYKAKYDVYTLPLPYLFINGTGGADAPIEEFETSIVRHTYDDLKYTVGKTRTAEALWSFSTKHVKLDTESCSGLSASYPDESFGYSRVVTLDGKYSSPDDVNWQPRLGGLSATSNDIIWAEKNDSGANDDIRSNIETHTIDVGDNPNLVFTTRSTDPAGKSKFEYFTEPFDLLQRTGNQFNVGDIAWTMFTAEGINTALLSDQQETFKLEKTDCHSMSSYGNGTSVPLDSVTHPLLSGFPGVNRFAKGDKPPHIGSVRFADWISHSGPSNEVLYDVSTLVCPQSAVDLNNNNLKGYYMTCNDHLTRKCYIKIRGTLVEEPYDTEIMDCIITIDKEDAYSVSTHALYDDEVNEDYVMQHGAATTLSFENTQSWEDTPSGASLLTKMFAPYALWTQTTTPPFSGYSTSGPLSANDLRFVSVSAGNLPGAASIPPPNGGLPPPALTIDPGSIIAKAIATGALHQESVTYENTGGQTMTLTFNSTLHGIIPGEVWSYTTSAQTGAAVDVNNPNMFHLPGAGKVVVVYSVTPQSAIGTDILAKHTIQVDKGMYGINTQDTEFTLTLN